jgi:hypothetical protein
MDAAIARQRRCKHVCTETNQHAAIEELLEAVFSVVSASRLYKDSQLGQSAVSGGQTRLGVNGQELQP